MRVLYMPSLREQERQTRKIKAAAYCRVSTREDEQEESLERQKAYYEAYIKSRCEWELAGIYSDQKSGTAAKKRPGFQSMIKAAIDGQIDVILCKSISRFSRNIVDGQMYARQLKSVGVNVIFEKEGIQLSDPSSEMMFALLSAVAQSESQSVSDHVRVACEHRFAQGRYSFGNNQVLGYDAVNGKPVPNKDAWCIRLAFKLFVNGATCSEIARQLTAKGAKRLRSPNPFTGETVRQILKNEIYVGDKQLQKNPPKNFLTKQPDKSLPYKQYYLTNDHPPIISRPTWQAAQQILTSK